MMGPIYFFQRRFMMGRSLAVVELAGLGPIGPIVIFLGIVGVLLGLCLAEGLVDLLQGHDLIAHLLDQYFQSCLLFCCHGDQLFLVLQVQVLLFVLLHQQFFLPAEELHFLVQPSDQTFQLPISFRCILGRHPIPRLLQLGHVSLGFPQLQIGETIVIERSHNPELSLLEGRGPAGRGLLDLLGQPVDVGHDDLIIRLQAAVLQFDLCVLLAVVIQLLVLGFQSGPQLSLQLLHTATEESGLLFAFLGDALPLLRSLQLLLHSREVTLEDCDRPVVLCLHDGVLFLQGVTQLREMLDEEDSLVAVVGRRGLAGRGGESGIAQGASGGASGQAADDLALGETEIGLADRDLLVDLAQLAFLAFGHRQILFRSRDFYCIAWVAQVVCMLGSKGRMNHVVVFTSWGKT